MNGLPAATRPRLKLPDDSTIVHGGKTLERVEVDIVRHETHATVGDSDVNSTRMEGVDDGVKVPGVVASGNR